MNFYNGTHSSSTVMDDRNSTGSTIYIETDSPLITEEQMYYVRLINYGIIGQIMVCVGISTNTINIIVFLKMGFKQSMNICLFGLAISDLLSCLTLAWSNLCLTLPIMNVELPFDPIEVQHVTGTLGHIICTRITQAITAFVTLERCICVTFPLKVKNYISPTKVVIVIVSIYIFILGCHVPLFYAFRLGWKSMPGLNKTIFGTVFVSNYVQIQQPSYTINNIFMPLFFFASVTACTILISVNLKRKSKWRKTASASSAPDQQMTSRDHQATKTVVLIAIVYIICFTPNILIFIGTLIEPSESNLGGKYQQLFGTFFSLNFIFESINASANIFIYLRSLKYKLTFRRIFSSKKSVNSIEATK